MLRNLGLLVFLLVGGAVAPLTVSAAPKSTLEKMKAGTTQTKKDAVKFVLVNHAESPRTVSIGGQSYTLSPHQTLPVAAAQGEQVIGTGEGFGDKGEVLFTVDKLLRGKTVTLN
jgi:hypothetical protein